MCQQRLSSSCVVKMAKWIYRWKPIWISHGDTFQEAFVKEWEQEAHASNYSGQESENRGRTPVLGLGTPMVNPTERSSARLTHESRDGSESVCGPYWAPKPVNSRHSQTHGRRITHHLFLLVYLPCRNHPRIKILMLQGARGHSENTKSS